MTQRGEQVVMYSAPYMFELQVTYVEDVSHCTFLGQQQPARIICLLLYLRREGKN